MICFGQKYNWETQDLILIFNLLFYIFVFVQCLVQPDTRCMSQVILKFSWRLTWHFSLWISARSQNQSGDQLFLTDDVLTDTVMFSVDMTGGGVSLCTETPLHFTETYTHREPLLVRDPPPPLDRTPELRPLSGQRPPWIETALLWTETPGQKPPWTEIPWTETPPRT